jgi:P-type Ca2+ transporter type 2C
LMKQKPRNPRTGIFTKPVVILMAIGGAWSALINLGMFIWARQSGRSLAEAMTMTFVSLVLIQFLKAYNFRSDHDSIFHKPFVNRWLNLAIIWELILLGLIIYIPALHIPFGTFHLPMIDWAIIISVSLTIIPLLEIMKWMLRHGRLGKG